MDKSLQRLTETEKKFEVLLEHHRITKQVFDDELNFSEKNEFGQYLTELINEKSGSELDNLLEKISEILPQSTKNQLWENNQYKITVAISELMEEYGKMPTKNRIAEGTGLSRQTISKHLKDYQTHPLFAEEKLKFKFMSDRVLAKVYKVAISNGDIKAARLYFEVTGYLGSQSTPKNTFNTQNNFIQINQNKITQDNIKQLSPEQISVIEGILLNTLPLKEVNGCHNVKPAIENE